MNRGDVVLVDFPFADGTASKIRPALVVQANSYNRRLATAVLVLITGNLKHVTDPANLLIDPNTPDGVSSGLNGRSLVKCHSLTTIVQSKVLQTLGSFSPVLMSQIDDCLKAALDLH